MERLRCGKKGLQGVFARFEVGQRLSTPDRIAQGFPLAGGRPPARYLSLIKRHPLDLSTRLLRM